MRESIVTYMYANSHLVIVTVTMATGGDETCPHWEGYIHEVSRLYWYD